MRKTFVRSAFCGAALIAMAAHNAAAQDLAARQVCTARDGIQTQVQTLSSLSAENATKANVTT